MNTEIITTEEQEKMEQKTTELVTVAHGIVIKSEIENAKATAMLVDIRAERKRREGIFKPAVDKMKAAYDEVRALRDTALKPLAEAEGIIKGKVSDFVIAENARRDALQAKADAKFAKAAEKAEATGRPLTAAPAVISKVTGTSSAAYTEYWSAEVYDLRDLVKAIAAGLAPIEAITPNLPMLNKQAQVSKSDLRIPGVRPVKKMVTRTTGGR